MMPTRGLAQQPIPQEASADRTSNLLVQDAETLISPKQLVLNVLHDQKPIWTFPGKLAQGKHWKPVTAVVAGTAALIILDPYTEPFFRNRPGFDGYATGTWRGRNTTLAITLSPAAFYLVGVATHSTHARNTGMLAAEGIIDTQILSTVVKNAIGRLTPSDIPANGDFRDTWFKYRGSLTNRGGFPSGHTSSAFAVAAVVSGRYPKHKWVPFVAYGLAGAVSVSRLPTRAHFPSDIFLGAALGYGIGHFVVLKHQ